MDPIFREYYNYLGGEQILGPAISPARKEGNATTQFLANGKVIFDPAAPISSRFRLAPLGLEMDVLEPPIPPPADPNTHYIAGHTIPPDFYLLYEKIGANTVGKPLTEPRYNLIRKRYEQFYENLGFYRLEGSSDIYLLSYGTWVCDEKCGAESLPGESGIDIRSYIDPVFKNFVDELGTDFSGFALTDAYLSSDGMLEQVLENLVLFTDPSDSSQQVFLRPIAENLNIYMENPRPPGSDPQMYFYEVSNGKGYEIPLHFWQYILDHGGIERLGFPITHYSILMNQIYHQCFTHLCLTYDPNAAEGAQVRPEPLGYAYRVLYYKPELVTPVSTTPTALPTFKAVPEDNRPESEEREISLRIWQRYLVMEQSEGQEIDLRVTENGQPVEGKAVELTVKMPDGSEQVFQMPPTDGDGQSRLLLPEIKALNGTIVPFKVCYRAGEDLKVCVADIFVIWETP